MRTVLSRAWLALLGVGLGCASAQAPPGGEPDRSPPFVIQAVPEPMSVHPDGFDHDVEIRFNERISEKMGQIRDIDEVVLVSPRTGRVKIHRGRSSLKIHEDGGWKPGYIYHIYVRPVLQDLFGNKMNQPIDLIFSTGPEIPNTTLGGIVENRIDGKPVADAVVDATARGTRTTYAALSDTSGFFSLRYVPADTYDVVAFEDRNTDGKLEFPEPVDTTVAALAVNDTTIVTMPLLPGDTTPAKLIRAEANDSGNVTLSFDDYLDPDRPVGGSVEFYLLPDSTPAGSGELMHPYQLQARLAVAKAAADSAAKAAADSAAKAAAGSAAKTAADSMRQAGADTAAARRAPQVGRDTLPGDLIARRALRDTVQRDTVAQDTAGPPLPSRDVAVVPAKPLLLDTIYVAVVKGITNINNLPGGGGSARFRTPAPAPDTTKADSVAPPDSAGRALPDTIPPGAAQPDTVRRDTVPGTANPRVAVRNRWLRRILGAGTDP